jgi:hypothetical protein
VLAQAHAPFRAEGGQARFAPQTTQNERDPAGCETATSVLLVRTHHSAGDAWWVREPASKLALVSKSRFCGALGMPASDGGHFCQVEPMVFQ